MPTFTARQLFGRLPRPAFFRAKQRSSPVAPLFERWESPQGEEWAPSAYGDYLALSPVVYACVRLRAQNLSRVQLLVYRDSDKSKPGADLQVESSHPAQRLLDRPNPFWSRQRFWQMVEASLCLYGSAPIAIFRNARGEPSELWWLHPSRFRVVPDRQRYIQGYLYEREGRELAFRPQDVLWFRYPNPIAELAPLSPLASLRMTVDMNRDALRYNRRFFQNDATPGRVYLKSSANLNDKEAEDLRTRWEKLFKDRDQAHSVAVLGSDTELKSLAVSQRDMDFVEAMRFSKEEICGAYGLSPILVGDLRMATLNNFVAAKSSFWDETLLPEMELLEGEVGTQPLAQFGPGLEARFAISQISALREDQGRKAQRYEQLIRSGLMTVNEIRHTEGLPPVPWGDAPPGAGHRETGQ